jgi:uncharacterized protein YyaL (SSP411 family)
MDKHTNRLANETSPYLLQHAHNPVDWYPWGEEAFEKARSEDKPVLVSIGYAACHWCHVMERESFENEETAALMNQHFINIKVDREERPDVDHIYMDAVQAMAGNGGWPLNVFLTPEGKPFYGGTYFPPQRAFNRASWTEILLGVHEAYKERKHEIVSQAENLTAHLANANSFGEAKNTTGFSKPDLQVITINLLKQADKELGGFGNAPKFPQTFSIQYLLKHYYFTKDEESLKQALLSLDKMIYGGIYDQLGGGFARYSTDAEWLAPHFEKMLYDNALLIIVLAQGYQLTKKELYKKTIEETISFVERELMSEEKGFYSALDADSEGVEGKFYIWSKKEIDEILGKEAELFCDFYDVTEHGNWEHTNILRIKKMPEQFAADADISEAELSSFLHSAKDKLMQERDKRIRPLLDDKILLGWNTLMNIALSHAYSATLNERYKELAVANMSFIESKLSVNGKWHHTYKTEARINAFLDDLAYLVSTYIYLQEITGNSEYLIKAKELTEYIIQHFSDESESFFYFTNKDQKDVIVRKKEIYDGATPSGNAVMCFNLIYLSKVFDLTDWHERAVGMINSLRSAITRYPTSFAYWAQCAQNEVMEINEIAIVGDEAFEKLKQLLPHFLPNKVLQSSLKDAENFPLLRNRMQAQSTSIFLCKNYTCLQPVQLTEDLLRTLA